MGNSEVGHLNLGAGRIIYQNLTKINLACENHTLKNEKVLQEAFQYAAANDKPVHFLGLVSDGGPEKFHRETCFRHRAVLCNGPR
jgi:2,3-bisphosphoglycerate-independent phosphoglycerate mutase